MSKINIANLAQSILLLVVRLVYLIDKVLARNMVRIVLENGVKKIGPRTAECLSPPPFFNHMEIMFCVLDLAAGMVKNTSTALYCKISL